MNFNFEPIFIEHTWESTPNHGFVFSTDVTRIHKRALRKTVFGLMLVTDEETAAKIDSLRLKYHFGTAVRLNFQQ
jgi:hypothetical protein